MKWPIGNSSQTNLILSLFCQVLLNKSSKHLSTPFATASFHPQFSLKLYNFAPQNDSRQFNSSWKPNITNKIDNTNKNRRENQKNFRLQNLEEEVVANLIKISKKQVRFLNMSDGHGDHPQNRKESVAAANVPSDSPVTDPGQVR